MWYRRSLLKSILFFFLSIDLAYLISYLYGQPPINQIKKKDDKKMYFKKCR